MGLGKKVAERIKRMARKVKAVPMPDKYKRYMIVDENTGEVLDDAQGYGYKTAQKAHLAWNYKHATSKQSHNRKLNQKFVKEHKTFVREWDAVLFDCLKSNEKPSYSEFKEMLADKAPDFGGSSRSLFCYLQKH